MENKTDKTLVVETGILCNNHCVFCYQNGYRRIKGMAHLVDLDTVKERISWGAANGYFELSLTGGEPTIRKDFFEILRYAKSVGYQHISVTTNGSKLCDAAFFKESFMSGLDGIGVSLHGISSLVHDAVVQRDGAFAQAIRTIRNGAIAQQKLGGRRFRLNTFSVIHKNNVKDLPALTDMLAGLGVHLMILQPPVVGKSNISALADVSLEDVLDAVTRAARAAVAGGYLIKPFNIPPCMLPEVADGLDLTMYRRSTFRENDDVNPGARSRGDEVGFVRLPACERCSVTEFCPGLSLTLLPEVDLLKSFTRTVDGHNQGPVHEVEPVNPGAEVRPLWLTGTELLSVSAINRVLDEISGRSVWLCTGGSHRVGSGLYETLNDCSRANHVGIAFVHQMKDTSSADRIIFGAGNGDYLLEAFKAFRNSGVSAPVAICGNPDQSFVELLERLLEEGIADYKPSIFIAPPWRAGERGNELVNQILELCRAKLGNAGGVTISVSRVSPDDLQKFSEARFDSDVKIVTAMDIPVTPFENPLWSILNWSVPQAMIGPDRTGCPLIAESIDVKPF